ncbi:MAG: hypothetical protein C0501_17680 [Isosphaera sp.]|nr:hypothetical protein [Isosphaera sp.]
MLRNTVLGVAAVFGLSVWAWSRPAEVGARAPGLDVVTAGPAADRPGGTYDEAATHFRSNQAGHWWRQVVIRR